ncbi:MAG: adenylate/guanylate cyclase domain-containing protein [Steroidobacteraceae bacterium]
MAGGRALMIGFGVPKEQVDAERRAVDTAREMLKRFGVLAADWKRRLDVDTGLGISINAGEVIAGNVGSQGFMSYTIVSDTVEPDSRLSQQARAGEALMSSSAPLARPRGRDAGARAAGAAAARRAGRAGLHYCLPAGQRIDFEE